MKLMKKVAATLLGLTMTLSLGACEGIGGGQKADSTSTPNTPNTPNSTVVTGEGAKYMEGIVTAVREANTISMEISFDVSYSNVDKTYGKEIVEEYDGETYTYVDDYNDSASGTAKGNVTVTAAKAGETYSLSVTGNVSYSSVYYGYDYESDNYDEQIKITEEESIPLDIRIVADTAYIVNPEDKQWYKTPIDWEELEMDLGLYGTEASSMLGELYSTLMEGDLTEVYNVLGPIFEQTLMLDIKNQKYEFVWDIAADYNAALKYLNELDYTQTIAAYIDSILAQADTSLDEIFNEVSAKGTMTVQELYNEINNFLQEETGKDINGLKDEIIAKLDLSQFEGMVEEESFAQIQQTINAVSAMKIEEMLQPYMSLTINDLLTMTMATEDSDVTITVGMLTEQLQAMLQQMTLADALGEEYFEGLTALNALNLDELKESLSIQFNGYKIGNISYSAGVDFDFADEEMSMDVDSSVSVSISLSQETTSIVAPEGALDMPSMEDVPTFA